MEMQSVSGARSIRSGWNRPTVVPLVVAGTAVGLLLALWLTASTGTAVADALGLPDAGLVVRIGLPAVRVVADISAALTVGFLLAAAALTAPQASGYLDVAGYRSVRVAAVCGLLWAVAAFLMVPLTVAEALGRPVGDVFALGPLTAALQLLPTSGAWLLTAVLATLLAVGCRATLTWGWAGVLLMGAVIGVLPVAATGHSAVGGSHDIATDSLMIHVVAAAVWVGGLVAVLTLAVRPQAESLDTVLPRFSVVAGWCWGLMAFSGLVNLAVRVPLTLPNLLSGYGVIAMAKSGSLLLLGALGYLHRRRTVAPAVRGDRRALLRLGAGEVLLMLATIGLAVGLGRTPPPAPADTGEPSRTGEELGYEIVGPPAGVGDLVVDSRPDLILGVVVAMLLIAYLTGVRRLRRDGERWPLGRTVAWLAGCAVVLVATSSGIGAYGAAVLSVSVLAQVLLSLVAPLLLVLGAPLALVRRVLPNGAATRVLEHPVVAASGRPVPAVLAFSALQLVLYGFGLIDPLLSSQPGRLALDVLLLVAGLVVVGALTSGTVAPGWAVAVLVLAQAGVGVSLLLRVEPIAATFYRGLGLEWVPDLLVQQHLAGVVWLVGQVALVPILVVGVARAARDRVGPGRSPSTARGAAGVG